MTETLSPRPAYDAGNVFARILRGEIPCKKVFEDEHVLAFHDIQPRTPVHVLVIPKGAYVDFADFAAHATEAEQVAYLRAIGRIAKDLGVEAEGYRILSNIGKAARQEVFHLHVHIFAGRDLGQMID